MKKDFSTLIMLFFVSIVFAQKKMAVEDSIKQTINTFFFGMHKKDTSLIRTTVSTSIIMHTIQTNKQGESNLIVTPIENFFTQIVSLPASIKKMEERITFDKILIDEGMAMAWTPFELYFNDKFYSCGVNHFQLIRMNNVWKINFIIDTRRKDNCKAKQ